MSRQGKIAIGSAVALLIVIAGIIVTFALKSSKTSSSATTTTTTSAATTTTTSVSTTTTTPPITAPAGTALPSSFEPESATFVSPNTGFVLGISKCSGTKPCLTIARTENGGQSWVSIPAPNLPFAQSPALASQATAVSRIRFVNILDGYVFGPNLYATSDGGATWHKITLPGAPGSYGVISLETNGTSTYLIAGNPNTAAPATDILYKSPATTDSFAKLSQPEFQAGWQPSVVSNPYGTVIAVNNNNGDLYFQATGSSTWKHVNPDCLSGIPTNPAVALATPSQGKSVPQLVIACGGDAGAGTQQKTIVKTTDLSTFDIASAAPPLGGILGDIASPNGKTIVVSASSGATFLYLSTDGGSSWKTVIDSAVFGGAEIHDLGFTTDSQGFAVEGDATTAGTVSSRFLMTRDGGATWKSVSF